MEPVRKSHVVVAVLAAAVLFATYGTALPSAPFMPVQVSGPSAADSDGGMTVIADSESRRALILNEDGDLTGVASCSMADSPMIRP